MVRPSHCIRTAMATNMILKGTSLLLLQLHESHSVTLLENTMTWYILFEKDLYLEKWLIWYLLKLEKFTQLLQGMDQSMYLINFMACCQTTPAIYFFESLRCNVTLPYVRCNSVSFCSPSSIFSKYPKNFSVEFAGMWYA